MLEDTNVAAWVKLLVMCVMCKYCHWGGYTVLCHIALGVQVYLGDYCVRAMWQKRVSEGHHCSSRVILPPSGTSWLYRNSLQSTSYGLMYISTQIYQHCAAMSFSKQKITWCCQKWFPPHSVKQSVELQTKTSFDVQNDFHHTDWATNFEGKASMISGSCIMTYSRSVLPM